MREPLGLKRDVDHFRCSSTTVDRGAAARSTRPFQLPIISGTPVIPAAAVAVSLALILMLATVPTSYAEQASVTVTARVRPKISVVISRVGSQGSLLVRANVPWVIFVAENGFAGLPCTEFLEGQRTGNDGATLMLTNHLQNFTAVQLR